MNLRRKVKSERKKEQKRKKFKKFPNHIYRQTDRKNSILTV